jgi:transcriptional regulator with XRE-family HTH domain
MIVKTHEWTNKKVTGQLEEFPYFTVKCKLHEVLKERGLKMEELAELTGLRVATISELANMKRSTVSIPHIMVIAKALRIIYIDELIEFVMPEDTREQFLEDQEVIAKNGLLPEQDVILEWKRYENKLIKEFRKIVRTQKREKLKAEKAKAQKEKPTTN